MYLNVDKQLQEVFGWHDDGGVERDHIAFVQVEVQIGSQALSQKMYYLTHLPIYSYT